MINFYPLLQFTADSGFDDPDSLKREDPDRQKTVFAEDSDEQVVFDL
jgi:hypothetical protein